MIRILSPIAARELAPGDELRCQHMKGLSLIGREDGRHSWSLYYTTKTGQRRRPTLGRWPDLNIEGARKAAREIREAVARGEDPGAELLVRREGALVSDLCDAYLKWADVHKGARSVANDRHTIEKWVRPVLGRYRVMDVSSDMIDALLKDIYTGRYSALGRAGKPRPVMSNRTRALLSKMFSLARGRFKMVEHGDNPVRGTKTYTEQLRKVVATPEQLRALGTAAQSLAMISPAKGAFMIVLLLTGARVGEILNLNERELVGGTIVLKEHKTAKRIGEKTIAVPRAALEALARVTPDAEGYYFRGVAPTSLWKTVRRMAGVGELRLQDLRRTFASTALDAGYTLPQIGQQLGHTSPLTTARYSWLAKDKKQEIAENAGGRLAGLLSGPVSTNQ